MAGKPIVPLLAWCVAAVACSDTPEPTRTTEAAPEPPWPEWAYHHWVWEDESTQESALALVDGYLERDIPVGAVIIDSPWATDYNTLEWDTALFPDPQGMLDAFHDRGVRVFLWTVAGINTDVDGLYAEAADAGYFMQTGPDSGPAVVDWWKGEGSLIDFFNPDAVQWWHERMDHTLAYDIDGWKCDGLDFAALIAPYSPGAGRTVDRVEYSHAYYRDSFDYLREKLGDDRLITARPIDNYGSDFGGEAASFAPIDINWAGWVGDQDPGFDGLIAALNNMYHSSAMGYVAFGSDIGGYREDSDQPLGRTKESFVRWAQLGALNPVMENGGGGEHRPWLFDDETTEIYRAFTELHYDLLPYLMEHGAVAFEEGRSLMTFQSKIDYSYLLGPDIFVAPMLDDALTRTVAFPQGDDWVYLFDRSQVFSGGTEATVDVPWAEFPVFLKEGSPIADTL